ncbi:phage antirepressor N-terminal domain-containing protein [Citrobacter koseri]|uniref:phage antirepressor N-terminal domain-containing protein n=1 Tax=Citrobacter koseri TaxID=545 RepID=UPI0019032472|nr:phage antirepressor N-terminal domain-containing protein [Citrobacter koseri]MBJ8671377.1 phage antirepressor N-terminal domain-containing protein [Citrobacter koseri]HEM7855906.1 phage antirepressor N-terminal domain-containing protein [Citrobacter koseri]HEM8007246.1 phage antirepressor N-terminal domain-containing protein [Citrobacter koseri]
MTSIAILEAVNTSYVPFNGQQVLTAMVAGVAYVAMRPIVENLGMSWSTQVRKLSSAAEKFNCVHMNMVDNAGCVHMNTPLKGGIQKMLCLPLKKLNGWLFSINPEKVRADIRDKLIQYQEECFTVLHDYWNKGGAENPRKKTTVDERTPLRDAVNMLVSKKHLMYPEAYAMIHQRFNVDSIEHLAPEQINDAIEYVHRVVLEGDFLGKQEELPAPKLDISFPMSWFAENAPYAIIRQQSGDTVSLDRNVLVDCSPAYRLLDTLTKAGYDVEAARTEIKALRTIMAEQSWALKEIASYTGLRDKACHSVRL